MSKIGISIKLDVTKLDKSRFFKANSGAVYVDLTMFLDPDNEGQYGDHGFATQSTTKEEREQQIQMPILGNGKIFYGLQDLKCSNNPQPQRPMDKAMAQSGVTANTGQQAAPFDDDVPF